jgi:hypothetical protein
VSAPTDLSITLKILGPRSMSGYVSELVQTRGNMLSMFKEWLGL